MENLFRYFENQNADHWGMSIKTCGHQVSLPHHKYPPAIGHPTDYMFNWKSGRTLKELHIVYIVTGSGTLETNNLSRKVMPGDVLFLYPNQWHRYRPNPKTGWEEYWVGFDGAQVDKYLLPELFSSSDSYTRNIGYHEEIIYLFQQALIMNGKKSIGFQKILTGIVWQLTAHLTSPVYKPKIGAPTEDLIEETLNQIRLNLKRGVDFKLHAEQAGLSYSHYRKTVREKTGLPPQQLLIIERTKLSERLLTSTHLTISEVAEQSGFKSVYYFSKCFRQKTGMTPTDWRKVKNIK